MTLPVHIIYTLWSHSGFRIITNSVCGRQRITMHTLWEQTRVLLTSMMFMLWTEKTCCLEILLVHLNIFKAFKTFLFLLIMMELFRLRQMNLDIFILSEMLKMVILTHHRQMIVLIYILSMWTGIPLQILLLPYRLLPARKVWLILTGPFVGFSLETVFPSLVPLL